MSLSTLASLSGVPGLEVGISLIGATYTGIENVKLYREQCRDLSARCVDLLLALNESSHGLEGTAVIEIADELEPIIRRVNRQVKEWGSWSRLKSFLQQRDIKDGLDRLNRDLDISMMKFNVQINMEMNRGQFDLKAIQERDNAEIRELLQTIVRNHDDMRALLNMHSAPAVEEMMESLQTQLMESDLPRTQEQTFKAGLWMLHENTSQLPPLTDLSGQVTLTSRVPVMKGSSNDIFQGKWLDREPVALRLPRALASSPDAQIRFEREVQIWRQLHHDNVVPLYGIVYINEDLYSVSPWMDNGTVLTYVRKSSSVDRVKLLSEIASGLEYLHTKGIVHGDLRGANVLVSGKEVARLSDFGLSKFLEDCDKSLAPSNTASLRWTAPEVLKVDGAASIYSDIWSFAMVCLEILTGEQPFNGKDDDWVRQHVEHGKHPERPSPTATTNGLSSDMWDVMCKCWSKKPESRPTMSEVRVLLFGMATPGSPVMSTDRRGTVSRIFTSSRRNSSRPSTADSSTSGLSTSPVISYRQQAQFSPIHNRAASLFSTGRVDTIDETPRTYGRNTSRTSLQPSPIEPKRSPSLYPSSISPNSSTSSGFLGYPVRSSSGGASGTGPPRVELDFISTSLPSRLGSELHEKIRSMSTQSAPPSDNASVLTPIEEATHNSISILNVVDGAVSSGTMDGLVEFLVANFHSRRHRDYRDSFLMACSDLTTPARLFEMLSRRFYGAASDSKLSTEERVAMEYNILMIIAHWLDDGDFAPDYDVLWQMKFFCERAIQMPLSSTMMDRALGLQEMVDNHLRRLQFPQHDPKDPRGRMLQSSELKPRDLAIALTLLEGDNYAALRPSDYIQHLSKTPSEAIRQVYSTNNKIMAWVTDSILHYDVVEKRADVLKFFIHVSLECRRLRNFSSLIAIVTALHSGPIENLKLTRKALTLQMQGRLDTLYDITNPEFNHRGYREALNSASTPAERDCCVPWLAVHLKELRKVLANYNAIVNVDARDLINFQRYVRFMDRTQEVVHYTPPNLEEYRHDGQLAYLQHQLRNFLLTQHTDEQLLERSKKLVAEEVKDYRTRKTQLKQLGFRV